MPAHRYHNWLKRFRARSIDASSGDIQPDTHNTPLRTLEQRRSVADFATLVLTEGGEKLGDVTHIQRQARDNQPTLIHKGHPAVTMTLFYYRTGKTNILKFADILQRWQPQAQRQYPQLNIIVFDQTWQYIRDRIQLLVSNALTGLSLILLVLFAFLNARIAFWVAVGIPTAVLGSLVFMHGFQSSINMIQSFWPHHVARHYRR